MKKSKLIVPALAVIAFSTAASITGTVAWFTASRSVSIDAGTYAVVKTNADLKCVLTDGVQTTTNGTVVTVAPKMKLTDASFDHLNKKFAVPNGDGDKVEKVVDLSSNTLDNDLKRTDDSDGGKIYTAFTWKMTLTVYFGSVGSDLALYLDIANSHMIPKHPTEDQVLSGDNIKTAKGFRMAFVGTSAPTGSVVQTRVWAGLQTGQKVTYISNPQIDAEAEGTPGQEGYKEATTATELQTVSKTSTTGGGTPYASALIDSTGTQALPADSGDSRITQSDAQARNDYLGTFKFTASSTVSLSYTVVCWYEGSDPEIQNRDHAESYQRVVADVSLKAISLKTA